MSSYDTLKIDRDGAIAIITIARPEKMNALNAQVLTEIGAVIAEFNVDTTLAAAILTGSGEKAFAAGADVAAMVDMTPPEAKAFSDLGHSTMHAMEAARFPILGAVNGFALGGGCELALACDFLYASSTARFGQPEVGLGVIPGFGGTQRLTRRVGIARAREICLTGEMIGADEALRIGLVNAVLPAIDLLPKTIAIAQKIATKGRLAVAQCKRVLLRGMDMPLVTANELEAQAFGSLFGTADLHEGMGAFLAKRAPVFTGQ